ncbi:MAG TPA: hypothetical protein ENL15_01590 [Firmicutes bacterium]|nr:hypothetical protein [Bacillota bacterium]
MNPQHCRQLIQKMATGSPSEKEKAREKFRQFPLTGYTKTLLLCEAPYFNDADLMKAVLEKLSCCPLTQRDHVRLKRALHHWSQTEPRAFKGFSRYLEAIRKKNPDQVLNQ